MCLQQIEKWPDRILRGFFFLLSLDSFVCRVTHFGPSPCSKLEGEKKKREKRYKETKKKNRRGKKSRLSSPVKHKAMTVANMDALVVAERGVPINRPVFCVMCVYYLSAKTTRCPPFFCFLLYFFSLNFALARPRKPCYTKPKHNFLVHESTRANGSRMKPACRFKVKIKTKRQPKT